MDRLEPTPRLHATPVTHEHLERRRLIGALGAVGAAGTLGGWTTRALAQASPSAEVQRSVEDMVRPIVGQARLLSTGLRLQLPSLADNGHLVPLRLAVDSPMTEQDHVRQVILLSSRNPVMRIATFHLGPWSGRAELGTRVRLAGTQVVVALAALSTGEFRMGQAEVVVTESACLDMG